MRKTIFFILFLLSITFRLESNTTDTYLPIKEYSIDSKHSQESFVFIEGKEYLLATKGENINITLLRANKHYKLKTLKEGESILYRCDKSGVYYFDIDIDEYTSLKEYKLVLYLVYK